MDPCGIVSGWWFQIFWFFTRIPGEMIQFDEYSSNGLKPPTRQECACFFFEMFWLRRMFVEKFGSNNCFFLGGGCLFKYFLSTTFLFERDIFLLILLGVTHGKDWNIFAEIWDIHFGSSLDTANGAISWVDRNRDIHPCLLRWSEGDSWNLLPQESGELQRWNRNVGQVFLSICQEKFSLGICGLGSEDRTSWRREVQRVTRWLRYVTENQIVCSSSLDETVNSDTWWSSMQKKAGVERWCAKGLLLK